MNLVPFPKLHFLSGSMTPLYDLADVAVPPRRLDQMFTDAFAKEYQLTRTDPKHGVYSACALMLRGQVDMSDVRRNVDRMKPRLQFVPWNRDGWKVGLCDVPSKGQDRSLLCLANNTCVRHSLAQVRERFLKLFRKKAFKHHFTSEGMSEQHFDTVLESLTDLTEQYTRLEEEAKSGHDPTPPLPDVL
jgi:tubulin epsilon